MIFCKKCQKKFKNKHGFQIHISKKHKNFEKKTNTIRDQKNNKYCKNSDLLKPFGKLTKKTSNDLVCPYCDKAFARKFSRDRHFKFCKEIKTYKSNEDYDEYSDNEYTNDEQSIKVEEISQNDIDNILEIKQNVIKKIAKNYNTSPNMVSKIIDGNNVEGNHIEGNGNIGGNCNMENHINSHNTQNNTFNIIALGNENIAELLSNEEQRKILKKRNECFDYFIKYIHCNKKYPQFHNMLNNDLKSNKLLIYDPKADEFIVAKKEDIFNTVIEDRTNDIEIIRQNQSELKEIDSTTNNIVKNLVDKISEEYEKPKSKFIKDMKDGIDINLYNKRTNIKDTKQKLKLRKLTKIDRTRLIKSRKERV